MKEVALDWLGTFWKMLISPLPQTFRKEAQKADGKVTSAVILLIAFAVYTFIMAGIILGEALSVPTLLMFIILIPLTVLLFASMLNFICKRFLHVKTYIYDQLLYLTVSILVPILVIVLPIYTLVTIDIFRILMFILLLYQALLLTIAVKTVVTKSAYWQALVAVCISTIAGILISFVIFLLLSSLISPVEMTPPTQS